ncbi:hypothetical protein MCEGE14_02474 [Burkholderiaceae bacterium]
MTRISSYTQYQCKLCGQIHVKPEYGSVSSFVPVDIVLNPTDLKTCKRCGQTQEVQEYAEIGRTSTSVTIDTYPEYPTVWQRVRRRLDGKYCKKEVHVTDLYPRI